MNMVQALEVHRQIQSMKQKGWAFSTSAHETRVFTPEYIVDLLGLARGHYEVFSGQVHWECVLGYALGMERACHLMRMGSAISKGGGES